MADDNIHDISAEDIILRIRKEAGGCKTADTNNGGGNNSAGESGHRGDFQKQRIEQAINDIKAKLQVRTKIPDALNRFPVNKSKLIQRIILKFYELLFREHRAAGNYTADVLTELSAAQFKTAQETAALRAALQEKFDGLEAGLGSEIAVLKAKFDELETAAATANRDIFRQIKDHKLNITDMQRRLAVLLEEVRKSVSGAESFSALPAENMQKEESGIFDAMYAAFEDRFRGTRGDIKNRQKAYLPYISEAADKTSRAPIIDVGCGRGEWLELLKENGFDAKGIDSNYIMVNTCRGLGLDAVSSDAIEYLRSLPTYSLCAVTGFHIIEHLPFKTLIALFDESFRVLKPGGIVIFETPNPENLMVGACTFYTDPSHIKPLVPIAMQFIAEDRGFSKVEIKRLHKYSDYYNVAEENKFITENFYNEMDYAVIGTKL